MHREVGVRSNAFSLHADSLVIFIYFFTVEKYPSVHHVHFCVIYMRGMTTILPIFEHSFVTEAEQIASRCSKQQVARQVQRSKLRQS